MSEEARWDDAVDARRRRRWLLMKTMVLLSLDVTCVVGDDLALDEPALRSAEVDLRRVLAPALEERLAATAERYHMERLLPALDPPRQVFAALDLQTQALVRRFYDRVMRYADVETNALYEWGIVLARCAKSEALWGTLGLPAASSAALREAFWASREWSDILKRIDAALQEPLSNWDRQVAVLQLFPPLEGDDDFDIPTDVLLQPAQTVRRLSFWRVAAQHLGAEGLRALHESVQAYLKTQDDLARAYGRLYDPWLLAHSEITRPAT